MLLFIQAEPSFSAGHPGFDHFSGALLHDKTRAVQTLSKVSPIISPIRKLAHFVFDRHFIFDANISLPVRTTGSHLRMWPTSSTTPSSDQSLVSLLALRTLGKYVTSSSSVHRCSAAAMCAKFHILSSYHQFEFWTLACRWSWQQKYLEVKALGSLSPGTLEKVSLTRICPLSPSCKSHTTLTILMCCWSSATT